MSLTRRSFPDCAPLLAGAAVVLLTAAVRAAPQDWAEGTPGKNNGASRDYYNAAGRLAWKNKLGDWRDARNNPQGNEPYARARIEARDQPVEWDVTPLVREWLLGTHPPQGMLLRIQTGSGSATFASREQEAAMRRPQLILSGDRGKSTLAPQADTFLDRSTYRSLGHLDHLKVSDGAHALLRFDLTGAARIGKLTRATLRLHCLTLAGGPVTVGIFRCAQGQFLPEEKPTLGLAARYPGDRGIEKDPAVLFFADFETEKWADRWSSVAPKKALHTLAVDAPHKFQPLHGKALRSHLGKGELTALNLTYQFRKQHGMEPEEIYFRYYLRLGDDWNQTIQGGKMSGLSGTYGKAGWGGRRSDGTNGWSTRGAFLLSIPEDNPLGGRHPIGTYCYHADQAGTYGDIWVWDRGYRGFLSKNRWYSIEQYVKLNTPGKKDGTLRAWVDGLLAFEKTDLRFRLVDRLRIEQVWMNVYHGGTTPSPHDQHLFIDNVVIARKYIGPRTPAAP